MRGADVVAQTLVAEGVDTVFSLSGNQIMTIYDALFDAPIRLIHTRHEAAAGFMAEGYAQIAGRPGVALVTAGSGLGNAISPLITARASQTPLVLLSGDSPVGLDGQGAFQEMPQMALTAPLTKWSVRVTDPSQIGGTLQKAFAIARSGQPGPVHVALPDDVLKAPAPTQADAPVEERPDDPDDGFLLGTLAAAQRPLILLGPGMRGVDVPEGLPALRLESPRGAKDPSLGRFRTLWVAADLVVCVGKPIDFSLGFGTAEAWPQARWITVHGDSAEVRRAEAALGPRLLRAHVGDPMTTLKALAGAAPAPTAWVMRVREATAARPEVGDGLTSATLCADLASHIATLDDPIFVADGGEIGQWGQALVRGHRRIVNGVSGTIGAGISYAIGAKIAAPQAQVIALMGDGTAGFHLAEFETAAREGIAVTIVIGNDLRWNAEHALQVRNFGADRTHSCGLSDARYDRAAEALGATGHYVTNRNDLLPTLQAAEGHQGPTCVNVMIKGLPAPDL